MLEDIAFSSETRFISSHSCHDNPVRELLQIGEAYVEWPERDDSQVHTGAGTGRSQSTASRSRFAAIMAQNYFPAIKQVILQVRNLNEGEYCWRVRKGEFR